MLRRTGRPGGFACLAFLGAALAGTALASGARIWIVEGASAMAAGQLRGLSVMANGHVGLAPATEVLAAVPEASIWGLAAAGDAIYIATGDDGRLLQVDTAGQATSVLQVESGPVQAVAVSPTGELVAGVGQPARLYRGRGDGTPLTPWLEWTDSYVWGLTFDARGSLWAALGESGRVIQISADGSQAERYRAPDDHVRSIAAHPEGGVVAGTSGQGLVVRITEAASFVLLDSDFTEITAVEIGGGSIWAAGYAGGGGNGAAGGTTNGAASAGGVVVMNSASAGSSLQGGVYRVDPDGRNELVWSSADSGALGLRHRADGLWFSTAGPGRVFRLAAGGLADIVADLDSERVTGLIESGDGLAVATGAPARVVRLSARSGATGEFISRVRDAGANAHWGELRYRGAGATGELGIYLRTGNTAEPDESWSSWQGPASRSGAVLEVPPARFAQLRATLNRATAPVSLERIELAYVADNRRPQISDLRIHPAGVVYRENASFEDGLPFAQLPASVAAALREQEQQSGGGAGMTVTSFRGRPLFVPGLRTVTWSASDPDGDALDTKIEFRHEDDIAWKALAEPGNGTFTFDTRRVPDGRYQVRVVVEDGADNPEASVLSAAAASTPFLVDNTPPVIVGLAAEWRPDGAIRVTGSASDATSFLVQLRYSVDGSDWRTVWPADGVLDSGAEPLDFTITPPAGAVQSVSHSIVVEVVDSARNFGSAQIHVRR